jgi:hypothetical integral membrane protein (TIGR02206 family)
MEYYRKNSGDEMDRYFQENGNDAFILFSFTHLLTLATLIIMVVLIFLFRMQLRIPWINRTFRIGLAVILILSEISLHWWLWRIDAWEIQHSLPLHLSSISLLLSAVLLVTKGYRLFEFTFFAGVGSALQAMITPDISAYTFPHFRYVHFFISHGGIVVANLFIVFVEGFKPTSKSVWKAFFYLNLYTCIVFLLNFSLEGNYMYISEKPVNPSLLDYLGPWPYYLIPLELITLATFWLLYLPFWLHQTYTKVHHG